MESFPGPHKHLKIRAQDVSAKGGGGGRGGGVVGNGVETVTVFVCEKVNYSYYRLHIFYEQFLFRLCDQSRIDFIFYSLAKPNFGVKC